MVQIHKASSDQAEKIAEFQLRMAKETENLDLDKATVIQGVKAVFSDSAKGLYFVAISENIIIGSMLITYEWSDWRNSWVYWLQSVYVIPEMRQKGVFKEMFDHLNYIIGNSNGVSGVRLYVDLYNKRAINVYNSIGMKGDHYKLFELMK